MKKYFVLLLPMLLALSASAQVFTPAYLRISLDDSTKNHLLEKLDTLIAQAKRGQRPAALVSVKDSAFSMDMFASLQTIGDNTTDSIPGFYKPSLINVYAVSPTEYLLSLAFAGIKDGRPVIKAVMQMLATIDSGNITFATPLTYYTRNWHTKQVGNVTYHYVDRINLKTAALFNEKNTRMAQKLQLPVDTLDFYLCDNYQEILPLLGFSYSQSSNGRTRDGYGVVSGKIFSVMHSEDFSHDLLHEYVYMIRTNTRNRPAEEGLAYTWGNAYYTDAQGESISQHTLVMALKAYLAAHPGASLLELFNKDPKIFDALAKEVSVKTTIASVICDDIEKQKGVEGIKALVNCGAGDDNYFAVIDKLTGVNKTNFNDRVGALLQAYK